MKSITIVFLIFMCADLSVSQERDSTYKYWLSLGAWGEEGDVTLALNYSFSLNETFLSVGYFERGGVLGVLGKDGFHFNAINVAIGNRIQTNWFQISEFIGPSFVYGKKRSRVEYESFSTVGLDLQSQILLRPANEICFGLALYGNLNFVKNYSGFKFVITLGNGL